MELVFNSKQRARLNILPMKLNNYLYLTDPMPLVDLPWSYSSWKTIQTSGLRIHALTLPTWDEEVAYLVTSHYKAMCDVSTSGTRAIRKGREV